MPLFPPRSSNKATSQIVYPTSEFLEERVYRTIDGDDVDGIAFAYYGTSAGTSEAIYERNRWLARYDAILPGGLTIVLPVIAVDVKTSLWTY